METNKTAKSARTVTVTVGTEPGMLGAWYQASQRDLDTFTDNICEAVANRFGTNVQLQRVPGYGMPTSPDPDINTWLRALNRFRNGSYAFEQYTP